MPGRRPARRRTCRQAAITRVPMRDRAAVGEMLKGLGGNLDVIVPRGGKSLVARVQEEARVPVFAHLEGSCISMSTAPPISKRRKRSCAIPRCGAPASAARPRPCSSIAPSPRRISARSSKCCSTPAARCAATRRRSDVDPRVTPASEDDWRTEYLDGIIAGRSSTGSMARSTHIETYGSHHTDCIVTEDSAGGGALPARGRFGHRPAQCLDAIRRRRRIRLRRRDRHCDGPHACARPGRPRTTHLVQISRARHWPDPAVRERRVTVDLRTSATHAGAESRTVRRQFRSRA